MKWNRHLPFVLGFRCVHMFLWYVCVYMNPWCIVMFCDDVINLCLDTAQSCHRTADSKEHRYLYLNGAWQWTDDRTNCLWTDWDNCEEEYLTRTQDYCDYCIIFKISWAQAKDGSSGTLTEDSYGMKYLWHYLTIYNYVTYSTVLCIIVYSIYYRPGNVCKLPVCQTVWMIIMIISISVD